MRGRKNTGLPGVAVYETDGYPCGYLCAAPQRAFPSSLTMNETLTVRDFGPIREAEVTFKRVTVFIGPTGGGKSTLAKLAAVWREGNYLLYDKVDVRGQFDNFGIGNYVQKHTYVRWKDSLGGLFSFDEAHNSQPDSDSKEKENELVNVRQLVDEWVASNVSSMDLVEQIVRENIARGVPEDIVRKIVPDPEEFVRKSVFNNVVKPLLFAASLEYVPAERVFYSSVSSSLAGLMRDDIGLPKPLLNFINQLWQARKDVFDLDLPMFDAKYEYRNEQDKIRIAGREDALHLSEAASGIQSVAPLLVLLEHLSRQTERPQSFIIEEPELNLYPEAQQALLNVLIEKCAKSDGKNDLIITTHSPYLLSQLNLLLYAPQVAKNHPERAEEIKAMVPEASWIQPGDLAVYYVNGPEGKDGIRSLLDPETGLIAQNALDGTAGKQADVFDRLLDINSGF
jgi:predicted ATPase